MKARSARSARRPLPVVRLVVGFAVFALALGYLWRLASEHALAEPMSAIVSALWATPLALGLTLVAYAAAFWLRAWSWCRMLPALSLGQAWAALHVSLLGNHVLPLRLGEALRPLSVVRRTTLPLSPVTASALTLRSGDLLALLLLIGTATPALLLPPALAVALAVAATALAAGVWWSRRHRDQVRSPGAAVALAAIIAWMLEATVLWAIADAASLALSPYEAVGVTAVTIAAQVVAVTPGGLGSYEAAATAALVALGSDPGAAFAVALTTHAVKTIYALAVGGVALFVPGPSFWGRLRLDRGRPPRPPALPVGADAPIVVLIPAYDEEHTVGEVVRRVLVHLRGRSVVVLVVDDGSSDDSAAVAAAAGAHVVSQPHNLGLGAAVRRGLSEAVALGPAAVVYLDADAEYFPEDLPSVVAPILDGRADYVVGSRFAGDIRHMLVLRRFGNVVLTRWLRWLARRRDLTDGQSGFRAFSPAAAADAEIIHDYNYAQVLTLDLLAKGYQYEEVPITYTFRQSGTSFVRLGRYLRHVVPAVHRELNAASGSQSSTTWAANRFRAAAQATRSNIPSPTNASTAS